MNADKSLSILGPIRSYQIGVHCCFTHKRNTAPVSFAQLPLPAEERAEAMGASSEPGPWPTCQTIK